MSIIETGYVSVRDHGAEIGCSIPEVAIMPDNFATARSQGELRIRREGIALRSVLEGASFPLGTFCHAAEHASFGEEDFTHWEASLFFSATVLRREPYAVGVALSIIKSHLADYFLAEPARSIRLALILEGGSDRACRRLVYEGDIAGLPSLARRVRELASEPASP